jgi:chromosome segregation ATPase
MAEQGAHIRDVHSLEELNNMIEYTGEAMANIEENVSNYIDGVKEVLDKQLEFIQQKLEEAEEKLSEAEEALSSCEASQEYDEESGEYRPSCSSEERAVESARKEVEEWKKKYDEGKSIVDECRTEIDDYNAPAGFIQPPGGHYLIKYMREQQTPKASQQLRDCIEKLYDILQCDVGGDPGAALDWQPKDQDKPLTEDERFEAFKKNVQGIKKEQAANEVGDANRAMRCPFCGRPIPLCTCNNLHADVHLYQQN